MKFSIEKQSILGLSLAAAILVSINALSYWSLTRDRKTAALVDHNREVLQNLETELSELKDAENGQRGYIITGEEHYLKPYYSAVNEIDNEILILRKLTAGEPNQQQRLDTLEPLIDQRLALIDRIISLRRQQGFTAAQQLVKTNRGQNLTDQIRSVIDEMKYEEQQDLEQHLAQNQASNRTSNIISSFGIVLSLLLLSLVYYAVSRESKQRRQAQAALQQANAELETRVVERTEELRLANQQLVRSQDELRQGLEKEKELNEFKSRIITTISHEYRTPLTTILSSAELLEHYSRNWSEEKCRKHLHRIQITAKHMTNLVSDMLFLGKAEVGRLEFNPAPMDLEEFCREIVEELRLSANSMHAIAFIWQGKSNTAYLDEKQLRQILTNLLTNSLKYSPQGGTVHLIAECDGGIARFYVQDEGIGIPVAEQPQIFEFFHRASNVGNLPGTGLGLAIVKKCVDLHGGQISVESVVNQGTTFTVVLPFSLAACLADTNSLPYSVDLV